MSTDLEDDGVKLRDKLSKCVDPEVPPNEILSYDMSKKGYAVVLNHIKCKGYSKRTGTEKDVERLKKCMERLNFNMDEHHDLEYRDIMKVIAKVAKMTDISCLIIFVLTHGENHNQISAKDRTYSALELWMSLKEKLNGIPKLFFIQACRGSKIDIGYDESDSVMPLPDEKLPMNSDMLQMFSSFEGYYSYRENEGSWFITELCEVFECHANSWNLLELLTFVNKKIALKYTKKNKGTNIKQMTQIVSTLSKTIKFDVKNTQSD